jgi:hypothetical protein
MKTRQHCIRIALVILAAILTGCASLMGVQYKDHNGVEMMYTEEKVDGLTHRGYVYHFKQFSGSASFMNVNITVRVMDKPAYPKYLMGLVGNVVKADSISIVVDGVKHVLPLFNFTTITTRSFDRTSNTRTVSYDIKQSASYLLTDAIRDSMQSAKELHIEINGSMTKIQEEDLKNFKAILR